MILNIKEFREVCKTIATAVDTFAANLELKAKDNELFLSVTNKEYFTSVKYQLESTETFRAVVDANLFLNLISGITTDTIEITTDSNVIKIKAGKSNYKLPMIFENDSLIEVPVIAADTKTIEMPISNTILQSILTINSKELLKLKTIDNVSEIQKLYYITEDGAFNCSSGAILNSFTLEKPVQMLLNDRIVKLFKLFKDDVHFSFGYKTLANGTVQTIVSFETDTTYLAAIIVNTDVLLNKIKGPYAATKSYMAESYPIKAVINSSQLLAAINRIILFTKNSSNTINNLFIPETIQIDTDTLTILDKKENIEVVSLSNESYVSKPYIFNVNLVDLKFVLETCKDEFITLNCGNERSIILNRGTITNLIPECVRD